MKAMIVLAVLTAGAFTGCSSQPSAEAQYLDQVKTVAPTAVAHPKDDVLWQGERVCTALDQGQDSAGELFYEQVSAGTTLAVEGSGGTVYSGDELRGIWLGAATYLCPEHQDQVTQMQAALQ